MRPEDALSEARRRAAEIRAAGGYPDDGEAGGIEPLARASRAQLLEWALIEPDVSELRSTRRLGGPVTRVKRLLLRGLQQYHNELISQQARFNIHVVRKLLELEDRIERLERER